MSIYLLQTLAYKNTDIYKFGCTTGFKVRMGGYDKGSEIIGVWPTFKINCRIVERHILKILNDNFIQYTEAGTEYFKGSLESIVFIINKQWQDLCSKERLIVNSGMSKEKKPFIKFIRNKLENEVSAGNIAEFSSTSDSFIRNKILNYVGLTLSIDKFLKFVCELPSCLGFVLTDMSTVVIMKRSEVTNEGIVTGINITGWNDLRLNYSFNSVMIEHEETIYEFSISEVIETFLLGEPCIAKYFGIIDRFEYNGKEFLNLYNTIPKIDMKGEIAALDSKIHEFVRYGLAFNNHSKYEWIINWMINISQNSFTRTFVCPCFIGNESVVRFLNKFERVLFRNKLMSVKKLDHIIGENTHLLNRRFVICDEVDSVGEFTDNLSKLVSLIIEDQLTINSDVSICINKSINLCIVASAINNWDPDNSLFPLFVTDTKAIMNIDSLLEDDTEMEKFIRYLLSQPMVNVKDMKLNIDEGLNYSDNEELDLRDWNKFTFDEIMNELDINSQCIYGERCKEWRAPFPDIWNHYKYVFQNNVNKLMKQKDFYIGLRAYYKNNDNYTVVEPKIGDSSKSYLRRIE